jgi:hypothetical protein
MGYFVPWDIFYYTRLSRYLYQQQSRKSTIKISQKYRNQPRRGKKICENPSMDHLIKFFDGDLFIMFFDGYWSMCGVALVLIFASKWSTAVNLQGFHDIVYV